MIITILNRLDQPLERCDRAVAIGVFDGIHIGHRAVIAPLVRHLGLRPTVVSFFGIPDKYPLSLASREAWEEQLERMTIEEAVQMPFSLVRDLSPADFVKTVLVDRLCAKLVRVGENFRFGKNAVGDAVLLTALCRPYGITVEVAAPVAVDGIPVSSTRIRTAVEQGDMATARRLLGRPFTIDFEVQSGQHLGRTLGTPTINQPLPDGFIRPRFGVYATVALIGGRVFHGVTNVGVRPTVGAPGPLAETWLPDFIGDLYHARVSVCFVRFLRDETKFGGLTALKEQITRDEQAARAAIFPAATGRTRAVLCDFDDTIQDSDRAFGQAMERLLPRWFPHWPAEKVVVAAAELVARRNGGYIFEKYRAATAPENRRWHSVYTFLFNEMLAVWGEPGDPVAMTVDMARTFPWCGVPFDGVLPLLARLRKRGLLTGIVTNGSSDVQGMKLDNAGIRPLCDIAVVSRDVGVHKPDPAIFRFAAACLGVHPADCLFIGDHLKNDVIGARAAGMRALLVTAYSREPAVPAGVDSAPTILDAEKFL